MPEVKPTGWWSGFVLDHSDHVESAIIEPKADFHILGSDIRLNSDSMAVGFHMGIVGIG